VTHNEITLAWWMKLLNDEEKLNAWLIKLYHNEYDAYWRFKNFAQQFTSENTENWFLFMFLAEQELRHSVMVKIVIHKRGIVLPQNWMSNQGLYWEKVLPCIVDLETAAGVGTLAESLSFERLRVLASCCSTPADLKELFDLIIPDERIHTQVLRVLAKKHGVDAVMGCHESGLEALGLKFKGGTH
jgi:tRNA isopentenyl-2-thiomethyl-A-37 hydroxylase MiaE